MNFSSGDIKSITRRMSNIPTENLAYSLTVGNSSKDLLKLLEVDHANNSFFTFYDAQCKAYEGEARGVDGKVAAVLIPPVDQTGVFDSILNSPDPLSAILNTPDILGPVADFTNQLSAFSSMFPDGSYKRLIPLINDGTLANNTVKGRFHPTSTDSRYELNILSNSSEKDGLLQLLNILDNGLPSVEHTTSTIVPLPSGQNTSFNLEVDDPSGYTPGELILVNYAPYSSLLKINNISGQFLIVTTIIPSSSIMPSGSDVTNYQLPFTNTERQNMTHPVYSEYLNGLGNRIIAIANEWLLRLQSQLTAISTQNDKRSTYQTYNNIAKLDLDPLIPSTRSALDHWLALSFSGIGQKFSIIEINSLRGYLNNRIAYIPNRVSQIDSALGGDSLNSLSQSGNLFSATDVTNSYYSRYIWLDVKSNKLAGSLRRSFNMSSAIDSVQQIMKVNNAVLAQYQSILISKSLILNDGTDTLHLDSNSGFSVGDIVYAVSETQGELQLGIIEIQGTNQVKVDKALPLTYTTDDKSRIFKLL
jgi:hypothetical protein